MAVHLTRGGYLAIGEDLTHPRYQPVHRRLSRWGRGRGPLGRALGVDMILVTCRGRRTGVARIVPLAAIRDEVSWLVVGSNAGKARMPSWVHNLRTDPGVSVDHRGAIARHVAREPVGAELERCWRLVVAVYPGFAVYRDRTDRVVPIFRLEPAAAT